MNHAKPFFARARDRVMHALIISAIRFATDFKDEYELAIEKGCYIERDCYSELLDWEKKKARNHNAFFIRGTRHVVLNDDNIKMVGEIMYLPLVMIDYSN